MLRTLGRNLRQAQIIEGAGQKFVQIFPLDPIFFGQSFQNFLGTRAGIFPKMRIDDEKEIFLFSGVWVPSRADPEDA